MTIKALRAQLGLAGALEDRDAIVVREAAVSAYGQQLSTAPLSPN